MYAFLATKPQSDEEIVHAGYGLGYGSWLHPMVGETDLNASSNVNDSLPTASDSSSTLDTNSEPTRRGRGRPRVNTPRDESAVEKRRAQVREAQRAYQKRKDSASASERRRCDDVLQVLSDLSMDVEALLQAALDTGVVKQEGEMPDHIRRLWSTYDAAINTTCLGPELRLLQVKNERRKAAHRSTSHSGVEVNCPNHQHQSSTASSRSRDADLDIGSVNDSTLITTFATAQLSYPSSGPRSIYQACANRQAEFHAAQNPA